MLRDLTDRKQLEDNLRAARDELELRVAERTAELRSSQDHASRSERLAAIGQTVMTLAHEGRNALQRAMACLGMLGWKLEGKGEETDLADRIRKAIIDLERLFEDLRDYTLPIKLDVTPCNVRSFLRDAWEKTTERRTGRVGELIEKVVANNVNCYADGFRLGQVFTNIFENAFDACTDPVRITVTVDSITNDGKPGARITVAHSGAGFTAEAKQRALEPFFSTKPNGTGLRHAIIRRLIEAHGGMLTIEDAPAGATITIVLPG